MRRTTSVLLDEHFENFIGEQVDSGCFDSASEVVEEGLRLLERHQHQLDWLRARIAEADADIAAGNVHEMNDEFWERVDREVDEMVERGERPSSHVCP